MGNELASDPVFCFLREVPQAEKERKKWHCTGAYLKKHRPDIYAAVVEALCEPGVSIRSICRAYPVTDDTVKAVEARESENLAALKRSRLGTVRHVQRLALDRLAELAPTAGYKDSGIVYGILTEKAELESGNPTQRIETIDGGRDLHRKFAELTEHMIKLANAREIGLAGENGAANGRLLGPGDSPPIEVQSDSQSDVLGRPSERNEASPTEVTAISAANPGDPRAAAGGEGGVSSAEPPPAKSEG